MESHPNTVDDAPDGNLPAGVRPEEGSLRGCIAGAAFGLVLVSGLVALAIHQRAELELAFYVQQAEKGELGAIASLASHPGGLPPLAKLCGSGNEEIQRAALVSLGDLLHERHSDPLSAGDTPLDTAQIIAATRSDSPRVRKEALRILARLSLGEAERRALQAGLFDPDLEVAGRAGLSLAEHRQAGLSSLAKGLRSNSHSARLGAWLGLRRGLREGRLTELSTQFLPLIRELVLSTAPDPLAERTSCRRLVGEMLLFDLPEHRAALFVELLPKVSESGARSLSQHMSHAILEQKADLAASVGPLLTLAQGPEPGRSRARRALRVQLRLEPSKAATGAALESRLKEPGVSEREVALIKSLLR